MGTRPPGRQGALSRLHTPLGSPGGQGPADSTRTECPQDQPAHGTALPAAQGWVLTLAATVLGSAKTWASVATEAVHSPPAGRPGLPPGPPCCSWPPRGEPRQCLAALAGPASPPPRPSPRPSPPSCSACSWTRPRKREPGIHSPLAGTGQALPAGCHLPRTTDITTVSPTGAGGCRSPLLVAILLRLQMSGP